MIDGGEMRIGLQREVPVEAKQQVGEQIPAES